MDTITSIKGRQEEGIITASALCGSIQVLEFWLIHNSLSWRQVEEITIYSNKNISQ
jgi:hypothetical protein